MKAAATRGAFDRGMKNAAIVPSRQPQARPGQDPVVDAPIRQVAEEAAVVLDQPLTGGEEAHLLDPHPRVRVCGRGLEVQDQPHPVATGQVLQRQQRRRDPFPTSRAPTACQPAGPARRTVGVTSTAAAASRRAFGGASVDEKAKSAAMRRAPGPCASSHSLPRLISRTLTVHPAVGTPSHRAPGECPDPIRGRVEEARPDDARDAGRHERGQDEDHPRAPLHARHALLPRGAGRSSDLIPA